MWSSLSTSGRKKITKTLKQQWERLNKPRSWILANQMRNQVQNLWLARVFYVYLGEGNFNSFVCLFPEVFFSQESQSSSDSTISSAWNIGRCVFIKHKLFIKTNTSSTAGLSCLIEVHGESCGSAWWRYVAFCWLLQPTSDFSSSSFLSQIALAIS